MLCDFAGARAGQPEVYNLGAMIPELFLIVPFCAPAAEVADDAYRQLTLPGLERLLARARETERERRDDATREQREKKQKQLEASQHGPWDSRERHLRR